MGSVRRTLAALLIYLSATIVAMLPFYATALAEENTEVDPPIIRSSQPIVIQGRGLEAGTIWVLGEIHNDGTIPAYNVTVTAHLLTAIGTVAGTANHAFAFLGPGDTIGYRIDIQSAEANTRAEVTVDSSRSGHTTFTKLPITWIKNEQIADSWSNIRYEFTGALNNSSSQSVALNTIYVWFLDNQDQVVWMDTTYVPNDIAPGDPCMFSIRTPQDSENPQVAGITQVRYYAAGRMP